MEKYMCFQLGEEEFAVPLLQVKEVIATPKATEVPYTPKYFVGMMNLRGQVLSIVDLRLKMGVKRKEENEEEAVIILDLGKVHVGIVVDSINRVINLSDEQKSPPPVNTTNSNYIDAVYRDETHITLIVDLVKILNSAELQLLSQKKAA